MLKKLWIVLMMISLGSYGFHKDKMFRYTYGNVKVLVKTGWHNYGSTIDAQIIGKLTEKLAANLKYRDTIMLEFRHNYLGYYPDLIVVENGNSSQEYLLNLGVTAIKRNQEKSYKRIENRSSLCVRQMGKTYHILNTLKLIEYGLKHRIVASEHTFQYDLPFDNIDELETYSYLGMSPKMIQKISSKAPSELITTLVNTKTKFLDKFGVLGYYQNGGYYFETEQYQFKTPNLRFLVPLKRGVCVFTNKKDFIYLAEKIKKLSAHQFDSRSTYPIHADFHYDYLSHKKLNEGVFMMQPQGKYGIIFSEDTNEIIARVKRKKATP